MSFPTATPTLSTGGTYSANDYVGTNATPMEFTNCAPAVSWQGGGGGGQAKIVAEVLARI